MPTHEAILKGVTSQMIEVQVYDSTTGAGKTGKVYTDFTCYYVREGGSAATAVTLVTATLGTFTSGGLKEISAANAAGAYQFGVPNAAIAAGAGNKVTFYLVCAGCIIPPQIVPLVAYNPQDPVRMGQSALPNAAAAAAGGLPILGTGAGGIHVDGAGGIYLAGVQSISSLSISGGLSIANASGDAITISSVGNNGISITAAMRGIIINADTDASGWSGIYISSLTGASITLDGVMQGDIQGNINGTVATVTNLTTNNDKTGYGLSAGERTTLSGVVRDANNTAPAPNSLGAAVNAAAASAASGATSAASAAASAATAATQSTNAATSAAANATTLTAIKGAGWVAGDNLHQIRQDIAGVSGGGGGGGFSGASSVTLSFVDAGANPVPNVVFTIVGVGTGATDVTGVITIALNDGNYTVRAAPVAGTLFANAALVVAGATALTITGTADTIPAPSAPGLVAGYVDLLDTLGAPAAGGQIEVQRTDTSGAAGTSVLRESVFADADATTGRVIVNVQASKTFRARRDNGPWVAFTAPGSGTFALPLLLGQAP